MNIQNITDAVAAVSKKTYSNVSYRLFGGFKVKSSIQLKEGNNLSAEELTELLRAEETKFYPQESTDEKVYFVVISNSKIQGNLWIEADEPEKHLAEVRKFELLAEA